MLSLFKAREMECANWDENGDKMVLFKQFLWSLDIPVVKQISVVEQEGGEFYHFPCIIIARRCCCVVLG